MKLSYFHIDYSFSFKSRTTALLKICTRGWNLLKFPFFCTWKCEIHTPLSFLLALALN